MFPWAAAHGSQRRRFQLSHWAYVLLRWTAVQIAQGNVRQKAAGRAWRPITAGSRRTSISRTGRCEIEARDLRLLAEEAALPRHRFRECGRRWRPRAI